MEAANSQTNSRAARSAGITLALSAILHAFTHAYSTMLVPLYLLMAADLKLRGVNQAALVVTVYMLVYSLGSYLAGVLADRLNRRDLLGWGLIVNAVAIVLIGLTRDYQLILLLAVVAGLAGTLFHPAANSLAPEHFPKSPGMAIGLLGMGSGLGFFVGPQFAGWRAETAHWQLWHVAAWQRPCVELGLVGVACGFVFLLFAREARVAVRAGEVEAAHPALGKSLRWKVIAAAGLLSFRDFAGIASLSLASIYLQKALGFDTRRTGFVLGTMMLIGIVANPLAVYLSPGKRRLPGLIVVVLAGGVAIAAVPLFPGAYVLAALCVFQCFQLGSYAISDAAILERVDANVRGRVVGLFLMIAGTVSGTSPWAMAFWTDTFGADASHSAKYLIPFAALGVMMAFSALAVPVIARMGDADESAISPLAEIDPRTMEAV